MKTTEIFSKTTEIFSKTTEIFSWEAEIFSWGGLPPLQWGMLSSRRKAWVDSFGFAFR